jgi:hypothetical protein
MFCSSLVIFSQTQSPMVTNSTPAASYAPSSASATSMALHKSKTSSGPPSTSPPGPLLNAAPASSPAALLLCAHSSNAYSQMRAIPPHWVAVSNKSLSPSNRVNAQTPVRYHEIQRIIRRRLRSAMSQR